jgi:hypothetical protein
MGDTSCQIFNPSVPVPKFRDVSRRAHLATIAEAVAFSALRLPAGPFRTAGGRPLNFRDFPFYRDILSNKESQGIAGPEVAHG